MSFSLSRSFPAICPGQETMGFLVMWRKRKYLASKNWSLHANRSISFFRLTTSCSPVRNKFTLHFSGVLYASFLEKKRRGVREDSEVNYSKQLNDHTTIIVAEPCSVYKSTAESLIDSYPKINIHCFYYIFLIIGRNFVYSWHWLAVFSQGYSWIL